MGRNLCLRYRDPRTGAAVVKVIRNDRPKEGRRRSAGKWEEELRSGKYKPASKITWAEFRIRYESEVVEHIDIEAEIRPRPSSRGSSIPWSRILSPNLLSSIDADEIEVLKLRPAGRAYDQAVQGGRQDDRAYHSSV